VTSTLRRAAALGALALAALGPGGGADAAAGRVPSVRFVYPAGGRRGSSFDVAIGGQHLMDAVRVEVSGDGVRATIVERDRPLTAKDEDDLQQLLRRLAQRRRDRETLTPEETKAAEDARKALQAASRRRTNPALGESLVARVEVAADAPAGRRELRVASPDALSSPVRFLVDDLPEYAKPVWRSPPGRQDPRPEPRGPDLPCALPAALNGQLPPGAVDRWRFAASKGQRLVVVVRARDLIPYIADAVPGWLQATVTLEDAGGRELAYEDDYRFRPDPVLSFRIPEDGPYVLAVRDALYRGREDFVYRIEAGEIPFVTDVFPLGGAVGAKASVGASGWNLRSDRLAVDLAGRAPGILAVPSVRAVDDVPFDVDALPERLEKEPNDDREEAESVAFPLTVNGRIDLPGDVDSFAFLGTGGQRVVAEVVARRLGSPVDSVLRLEDRTGKVLAANDDTEDRGLGLETHHADSYLSFTLPTGGAYVLRLADAQRGGGRAFAYRLRLSGPRPDFELRSTPSSLAVRGGASVPVTVYALRRDGFDGDVELALEGAPPGFELAGGTIPKGADRVQATLSVPASVGEGPLPVRIVGRATVGGLPAVRAALPADDVMQAFLYRHLVPAQSQQVLVLPGSKGLAGARWTTGASVRIPVGGSARASVGLAAGTLPKGAAFELPEPPPGVTVESANARGRSAEVVFRADATAKAGTRGNLVLVLTVERGGGRAKGAPRRAVVGSLPALPFEIVER
jgi:hypothetical protein